MTSVLAFDTSGPWCSVCISSSHQIIAHDSQYLPRAHSRELIPLIKQTLAKTNLTFKDIDRIATLTGPGSFTGLRVGLATAQGLSYALKKPLIGINAFQAYAAALQTIDNILVIIDTQKEDVYCQLLDHTGKPLKEAEALKPDMVAEYATDELFTLTGDGCAKVIPFLEELSKPFEYQSTSADLLCQKLAILAQDMDKNEFSKAEPFYLNPPKVTLKTD